MQAKQSSWARDLVAGLNPNPTMHFLRELHVLVCTLAGLLCNTCQYVPILPYLAQLKGLEHRTYAKGLTSMLHDGKISTEHSRPDASSKYMYLRIINGLFFIVDEWLMVLVLANSFCVNNTKVARIEMDL